MSENKGKTDQTFFLKVPSLNLAMLKHESRWMPSKITQKRNKTNFCPREIKILKKHIIKDMKIMSIYNEWTFQDEKKKEKLSKSFSR